MHTKFVSYKLIVLIILIVNILQSGCKKAYQIDSGKESIISPVNGTRKELILDSVFLYAKQIYLWNDVIPDYKEFSPRTRYSQIDFEPAALQTEIFDISQLKINEFTGIPYEWYPSPNRAKYSYMQYNSTATGSLKAGVVNGVGVLIYKIIDIGHEKIAYVALDSFPELINIKSSLNDIFNEFAMSNPKTIVIDLRGNSGGFVETAEYIGNLIVNTTMNDKLMYSEVFNSTLQTGKASILRHQPYLDENNKTVIYNGVPATMADVDYRELTNTYKFSKKGKLETIQNLYFIVSSRTASASEFLINTLKPYLNVKLVGEKTYGKPVGFFGINIPPYSIYLSSFVIKNSEGKGDYYLGMNPDIPIVGVSNPSLGNPSELCLNAIINDIGGSISTPSITSKITNKQSFLPGEFSSPINSSSNIMIEHRFKLK